MKAFSINIHEMSKNAATVSSADCDDPEQLIAAVNRQISFNGKVWVLSKVLSKNPLTLLLEVQP